jgi:inorganic pyrophosphatase
MAKTGYLKEAEKFEIQAYKQPEDFATLRKTHVAFSGTPKRHPYDADKVVLVADPYSTQNLYYEFSKLDISYVEELPSIVNLEGETVTMVRIWIKKMSIGLRCSPFIVEDVDM